MISQPRTLNFASANLVANTRKRGIVMNVVLMLSKITRLFVMVVFSLISLHLVTQFARFSLDIGTSNLIFGFFLNEFHLEQSIPTFCSATALLFYSFLPTFITWVKRQRGLPYTAHSELSDVRLIAPSQQELL